MTTSIMGLQVPLVISQDLPGEQSSGPLHLQVPPIQSFSSVRKVQLVQVVPQYEVLVLSTHSLVVLLQHLPVGQAAAQIPPQVSEAPPHLPVQFGAQQAPL